MDDYGADPPGADAASALTVAQAYLSLFIIVLIEDTSTCTIGGAICDIGA